MKMYRATLDGITEIEASDKFGMSEHVDAGTWESYSKTRDGAKTALVTALEKRLAGALQSWETARDRLAKARLLQ